MPETPDKAAERERLTRMLESSRDRPGFQERVAAIEAALKALDNG